MSAGETELIKLIKLINGLSSKMESGFEAFSKRLDEVEADMKTAAELKALRKVVFELNELKELIKKERWLELRRERPHIVIWGVLQQLNDDVLDEAHSTLKFDDAPKDLVGMVGYAGWHKVFEEVGEREFESLRVLVDWLKSLTVHNITKGVLAYHIMGKDLVDEVLGFWGNCNF
jgi:Fe2+ transport system protein B